ncbi:FAD:protein FMN transferase [Blastopirellula sp. JC732]|uniref:FAD:protein FMN transferase n=1 Tax=Blastopirellula sediminis TaxID=2894196 RepID=A0A9X1MK58_9BACT|nr:FAD:protein FMN transferase [Blastopirellula sediminis]MCC9609468.1 FAD:protein FMN transferase [Blastopirellula sediminis]MCC9627755.1 FAD:protein FMN transferase [Blastopirellula sediminis]
MSARKSNRRDFLRGKSAVDALHDITAQPLPPPSSLKPAARPADEGAKPESADGPTAAVPTASEPEEPQSSYLIEVSREAMACTFAIFLNAGQHRLAAEGAVAGLDMIDEYEQQLSIYRTDSEATKLNAAADYAPIAIEEGFFHLLLQAKEIYAETDGAFDVTAGPLAKIWGFYQRKGRVPSEEELAEALAKVGSQYLTLNADDHSVFFEKPEMEINLGGIGKGYALDRVADFLIDKGITNFLFHGGTSSVLARGSRLRGDGAVGWRIGVPHPYLPGKRIGEVVLNDEALGTSGAAHQTFVEGGRRYGHVLDPRTGRPAEGVLSTTIVAPTATMSDALSTACFVMGPDRTAEYCEKHPEIGVLFAMEGSRRNTFELRFCGNIAEKFVPDAGEMK